MRAAPGTLCPTCSRPGCDVRHGHWYCLRCNANTVWDPVPWEPRLAVIQCSECGTIVSREAQAEFVTILRPR